MSLINFNKPKEAVASSLDISVEGNAGQKMTSALKPNGLANLFEELKELQCIHFVSDGSWSMYDFLMHVLDLFSGPSNVWITTYSMTELSARILAKLKDAGKIKELRLLMDYKSKMRYPQVDQLIRNVADEMALTHLHAKLLIIQNGQNMLTVLGSANWTKNPRIEIGVIDKTVSVGLGHIDWISKKITEANGTE